MRPDREKLQALRDWPTASNAKELSTFLGFVNFSHSHVRHISEEARLPHEAASAAHFEWSEQCEEAFRALKWKLINSLLSPHSDYAKPFVLSTDGSGYGIGGVLLQEQDGIGRPIGYFTKVLTRSQKNYWMY